ncbi:hypothetical protein [Enterococcus sp. DIV0086]|uniref:hypothetical protein n=1 Tax=Enterococcus sp. DIV0086 TaxID=2774655 RepID=UPI003D2CAD1A
MKIMKLTKNKLCIIIISILLVSLFNYYYTKIDDKFYNKVHPTDSNSINNLDAKLTKEIFEKSIEASNDKDVEKYVKLIVPAGYENTTKELKKFFKKNNIKNTLISFNVLKEKDNHLLAEAQIKSVNQDKNKKKYRDNVSTMNVAYVKSGGKWLIEMVTTIDTNLLQK